MYLQKFINMKITRLNLLSEANLRDREMNSLRGGKQCYCSCYWEGNTGSSSSDNSYANYNKGIWSDNGCNKYGYNDNGSFFDWTHLDEVIVTPP